MRRAIQNKKKQASSFSRNCRSKCAKLEQLADEQAKDRSKISKEFSKQMQALVDQMQTELDSTNQEEQKLHSFLKQRMDYVRECQTIQTQRLKKMRALQDQYLKVFELNNCN